MTLIKKNDYQSFIYPLRDGPWSSPHFDRPPLTREEVLELWLELVLKQVQRWR